jgi:hypothetical protein
MFDYSLNARAIGAILSRPLLEKALEHGHQGSEVFLFLNYSLRIWLH